MSFGLFEPTHNTFKLMKNLVIDLFDYSWVYYLMVTSKVFKVGRYN